MSTDTIEWVLTAVDHETGANLGDLRGVALMPLLGAADHAIKALGPGQRIELGLLVHRADGTTAYAVVGEDEGATIPYAVRLEPFEDFVTGAPLSMPVPTGAALEFALAKADHARLLWSLAWQPSEPQIDDPLA